MLFLAILALPIAVAWIIIAVWRSTAPVAWAVVLVVVGGLYVLVSGVCLGYTAIDVLRMGPGDLRFNVEIALVAFFGGVPLVLGIVMIRLGVRRIKRRGRPAIPDIFA